MNALLMLLTALSSCACMTTTPLKKLDSQIYKSISNPVEGEGEKILKDLVRYYIKLDSVCDLIKENIPLGKKIVEEIKADGGPFVNKVKLKEELILEKYNWTRDSLLEMYATLTGVKEMWREIELSLRNPTRPTKTPLIDEIDVKHIID